MSQSMLDSLPGRENVAAHRLQSPFDQATTWLVWRRGMRGANLDAWVNLQEEVRDTPFVGQALSA